MALTAKQKQAIPKILAHSKSKDAAQSAGVTVKTLWQWRQQTEFLDALEQARERLADEAMKSLGDNISGATSALVKLLKCKQPNVRRLAAVNVLDFYFRTKELREVSEQMKEIRQLFKEHTNER